MKEWTLKEAYSKLLGRGIDEKFFNIKKSRLLNYYVKTIENENYILTVVSLDDIVQFYQIEKKEWD